MCLQYKSSVSIQESTFLSDLQADIFFLSPVATDHHVQFERNAVTLDFLIVKKCAAAYPHIGKDHLLISEGSTICCFGALFSIKTVLTFGTNCVPDTLWAFRDRHIVLFPRNMESKCRK